MYLLSVYCRDMLQEIEVTAGQTYTVGNTKNSVVTISYPGSVRVDINVTICENGFSITSKSKAFRASLKDLPDTVECGHIIVLDKDNMLAFYLREEGPSSTHSIDISREDAFIIGRSGSCGITVKDKRISGRHIELRCRNGAWYFRDLKSTNGTFHNGKRVEEGALNYGDTLNIGSCRLTFTHDKLEVSSDAKVECNLIYNRASRGIQSIEEPYPYFFQQSPRLKEDLPVETIELQAPPSISGKPTINWLSVLLPPILTVLVMFAVCYFVSGTMTMLYMSAPMTIIGVIMSVVRYQEQKKKYKADSNLRIEKYGEYLKEQIQRIEKANNEQRRILNADNPSVIQCIHIAQGPERILWDRKWRDDDFMSLRLGTGTVSSCVVTKVPGRNLSLDVDVLAEHPAHIKEEYATVDDCPVLLQLGSHFSCGIIGDRRKCVTLGKNLLVHAATHHSYEALKIVILCDPDERDEWSFARWLPHNFDDTRSRRFFADTPQTVGQMLNTIDEIIKQRNLEGNQSGSEASLGMAQPFYLLVCASSSAINHPLMKSLACCGQKQGIGTLFLFDNISNLPNDCHDICELTRSGNVIYERDHASLKQQFKLDSASDEQYDQFARLQAPIRIEVSGRHGALPTSISFLQGYQAETPKTLDISRFWSEAYPENGMAVPIGVRSNGEAFYFDIHEKRYGPHGLVAGMTGSGKSEMVQSWILSMAVRFPPSAVSFVLIDFKGTGLLLPFKNLPHLAGSISDLDTSIGRNLLALENELNRRKALLDKYGVSNITAYRKKLSQGKASEPFPYLFIVIDEFAEFRQKFPDFMRVVNSIFGIGRTLGVHIILMTQKPGSIIDEKMSANTRFRWCLKVANSTDSRDMLKHTDAARITNPGRAFVQVGEDEVFEQIQSYWSGAPYNPYRSLSMQRSSKVSVVDLYGTRHCYETEKTTGYRSEKNEIDAVVEYLDSFCRTHDVPRATTIWKSKLPEKLMLKDLIQVAFDGEKWNTTEGDVKPAVGLLDDPRSQTQYPLYLNFIENGHTVVYGSPGSGKTSFLHTAITSIALTYTPELVNLYLLDFGGGSLNLFKDMPHVGGVAISGEDEKIEKLGSLLLEEIAHRKHLLSDLGLVNFSSYQEATGEKMPYIILILDNFAPVLDMYPNLDPVLQTIGRDGGSCGVYLLVTAGTPNAVSYRLLQNIKFFIALRMTDKNDYASIVGRTEGLEPENCPGRGLMKNKPPLEFQTALPVAGVSEVERVSNIRSLSSLMKSKWTAPRARGIPVMPEIVRLSDYPTRNILLGLRVKDIEPQTIDFTKNQFLLISSEQGRDVFRAIYQQIKSKLSIATELLYGYPDGPNSVAPDVFDKLIEDLMPVMQERKIAASQRPITVKEFPLIMVAIEDLKICFDRASNDTIRRLASIVNLGVGLNVIMLVRGTPGAIESLNSGGDIFTMALVRKSAALLVGGCAKDHNAFSTELPYEKKAEHMKGGEAYLLVSGNVEKIKLALER